MTAFRTLFFSAVVLAAGCSGELPADKQDYAGLWKNNEVSLLITADGRVQYASERGGLSASFAAPIKEFNDSRITAGVLFITSQLQIDRAPEQTDGMWSMVVDGVELYRTDALGRMPQASRVPSLEQLRELVGRDLALLDEGIAAEDFTAFIDNASLVFQSQFDDAEMKNRYGAFVEHQVRLAPYFATDFVLTEEPAISDEGTLKVAGRYALAGSALTFEAAYVYAHPHWKAIGLHVNVSPAAAREEQAYAAYERGDYETAFEEFRRMAEAGDAASQHNLGNLYVTGKGTNRSLPDAIHWYEQAAAQGFAKSSYNLGLFYDLADGMARDATRAAAHYRQAAERGHVRAHTNLAHMYLTGDGVAQDLGTAFRLFEKAARAGDERAQVELGALYGNGHGVDKDLKQAFAWLSIAAGQQAPHAAENLEKVRRALAPSARAEAEALAERLRSEIEPNTGDRS